MPKYVLIVESPSKVNKIQSFLTNDYKVSSSKGHIRNMDPKQLGIDIDNDFKPEYIVMPDKKAVVSQLKKLISKDTIVLLATDYDREGEAIAWHLNEVLKINPKNRKRILFTEITKKAILDAINKPTDINLPMFYAQQARMVLDKLIGYSLSPQLWKKYNNYKLSAGRVQSVVLKLIIDREEEIKKFESKNFYKATANFTIEKPSDKKQVIINTNLEKNIDDYDEASKLINSLEGAEFVIDNMKTTKTKRKPPPPFITSTLQQEASIKLGMSPTKTMKLAQDLYENGLITYMRTDSLILSEEALKDIESKIKSKYGEEYYNLTKYKSKSKNSQEAHEACRPTKFNVETTNLSFAHTRLYKLIWNRTMACQMKPADVEIKTIKIKMIDTSYIFVGKFEKILFKGYTILYTKKEEQEEDDEEETRINDTKNIESILKNLKKGTPLFIQHCNILEKYSKPPVSKYTEASLIKKLDELGIGRPSTYSSMVNKVQDKDYVNRKTIPPEEKLFTNLTFNYPNKVEEQDKKLKVDGEKNKLISTPLGTMVNSFLIDKFDNIINTSFTVTIEKLFDEIASNKKDWVSVVRLVYNMFNPIIENIKIETNQKKNTNKTLGIHPLYKKPIVVFNSRFGPTVCLKYDNPKECKYANFKGDLEDITFDEACKLLIYPKELGTYKTHLVYLNKKKSFYLTYNKKNYSLEYYFKVNKNEHCDYEYLELEQAIKILEFSLSNVSTDKKINEDIIIKKGPYGFYIKYKNTSNIPIPKKQKDNALSLTLEEINTIIEKYTERKSKGTTNKKK